LSAADTQAISGRAQTDNKPEHTEVNHIDKNASSPSSGPALGVVKTAQATQEEQKMHEVQESQIGQTLMPRGKSETLDNKVGTSAPKSAEYRNVRQSKADDPSQALVAPTSLASISNSWFSNRYSISDFDEASANGHLRDAVLKRNLDELKDQAKVSVLSRYTITGKINEHRASDEAREVSGKCVCSPT